MVWQHLQNIGAKTYQCGFCDESVAPNKGYYATQRNSNNSIAYVYICHHCLEPTYFATDGSQTPGSAFGSKVDAVPETVEALYDEARNCMKVRAYTASILCCRKLLMNIAVAKGAATGRRFADYVNYLATNNLLPHGGKAWVDLIRTKGNEATHEIEIMQREDAEELITFSEMLLKFIYEYPARIQARVDEAKT